MTFSIKKKGYDKSEVDAFIAKQAREYEEKLQDQKNRIFQLKSELVATEKRLNEYQSKSELISTALINAVAKADEIKKLAEQQYREEMAHLKAFHDKWQAHYNKLLEKYPDDEGLRATAQFNASMDGIFSGASVVEELEKQFDGESARVKSAPIKGATLAENETSESGFSFAEAWNPTDDLSSIMKDLGLSEEDK